LRLFVNKINLSRPGPLYPRTPSSTGSTSFFAGAASSVAAGSAAAAGASVAGSSAVLTSGTASAAGVSVDGAATGSSTGFGASDMMVVLKDSRRID